MAARTRQPSIIFVSIPWRGHVNPLRYMAKQLLVRGYTVSFAIPDVRALCLSCLRC
jgi:UDP:flavonoid glycosyltransferase YjiC (YdhE family)